MCCARGDGGGRQPGGQGRAPPRPLLAGRSPLRSRLLGSGNSRESGSLLVMQKHLGVSKSLRISLRAVETSPFPRPSSPIFPVSHIIVPCLDNKRNYIIISIVIIILSVYF